MANNNLDFAKQLKERGDYNGLKMRIAAGKFTVEDLIENIL